SDLSEVIVIGATNREDLLDAALVRPGRLDYVLKFHAPDEKERLEIFRIHTHGRPLSGDVNLGVLAGITEGLVGSHIAFLCKRATMLAIADLIHEEQGGNHEKLRVSAAHFKAAIEELRKGLEPGPR
ncbi:MAG TPA: AAA family ATPase, partial [Thermoanaerobaculia bacterium]